MAYPYPGGGGYPPVSRIALQATGHAGRLAGAIRTCEARMADKRCSYRRSDCLACLCVVYCGLLSVASRLAWTPYRSKTPHAVLLHLSA